MALRRVRLLLWVSLMELVNGSDRHPLDLGMTGTPPLVSWHRSGHGSRIALRKGVLDHPLSYGCTGRMALVNGMTGGMS